MKEVCSSAEEGDRDLPKVTMLRRGQLSWDSNLGAMVDRGGGGEESPAGWPGEVGGAFLSLLAAPC